MSGHRFKVGDRVRIITERADGANVKVGDEAVITEVIAGTVDDYHVRPDVWRRTSSQEGGGGYHQWYVRGRHLEAANPLKPPFDEIDRTQMAEKIERLEKRVEGMREAQSVRATEIRRLKMELARAERERDALADTLAAINRERTT